MSRRFHGLIIASILALIVVVSVLHTSIPAAYAAAPSLYTMTSFSNSSETNMYVYQSTDGLNFTRIGTEPALAGLTPDYIDSFVVKLGTVYHIFAKNDQTNSKYIEHATATKLTGPYTFIGTGNWAGWGPQLEGPCVYQLDNGTWRILLDGYKAGQYYYSDSTNNFKTWTPKKPLPDGLSGFVRHLTVLREPGKG